jgi:hypothetical protein
MLEKVRSRRDAWLLTLFADVSDVRFWPKADMTALSTDGVMRTWNGAQKEL